MDGTKLAGALALMAMALGGCASHSELIVSHEKNEVTVRIVGGDSGPSYQAAREACGLDRRRATLIGVSSEQLKFACQRF
ncbi:hypothetical protein STAQ_09060 [Allostella sp. ATCC 35155]|nr:hypothetical protein STAQ_09060 [Stella sp. ATCC 35155]